MHLTDSVHISCAGERKKSLKSKGMEPKVGASMAFRLSIRLSIHCVTKVKKILEQLLKTRFFTGFEIAALFSGAIYLRNKKKFRNVTYGFLAIFFESK